MSGLLRVVLVEQGVPDYEALAAVVNVVERLRLDDDVLLAVTQHDPDVLVLDVRSPGRAFFAALHDIQQTLSIPVVIFSQDDAQETIQAAVDAGVAAYVVDSLHSQRVLPILNTAIARFRRFRSLENELADVKHQLHSRKRIEKAKGIIMMRKQLSEDEAYTLLRQTAMQRNCRLVDIADSIVAAAELL